MLFSHKLIEPILLPKVVTSFMDAPCSRSEKNGISLCATTFSPTYVHRKLAFRQRLRPPRRPSLSPRPRKLLFWRISFSSTLRRHVAGTKFESGLVRHLFFRTYLVRDGDRIAFTTAQLRRKDSGPFTGQPK